jgi:hypothetical protein
MKAEGQPAVLQLPVCLHAPMPRLFTQPTLTIHKALLVAVGTLGLLVKGRFPTIKANRRYQVRARGGDAISFK